MKKTFLRRENLRAIMIILLPVIVILFLLHLLFSGHGSTDVSRTKEGADHTPPSIMLTRDLNYYVMPGEAYEEEGYDAYDDRDGVITKKVEVSVEKDQVRYRVQDEAGNITIRFRQIPYVLSSGSDVYTETGSGDSPFAAGYETEGTDADTLQNPSGLTTVPDDKVIYLTFDDGPGEYTQALLDILDRYNVKATFFVTGAFPAYVEMIHEEYAAGHSIGVHTFSHDYDKIYASEKAFWKDFDKMQKIVEEQTGQKTTLMRFAGGTSCGVDVMPALVKQAAKRGLTYFDWNVSCGDGASEIDTETILYNITSQIPDHSHSVVLCHDTKKPTIDAIEYLIPWALERGYVFLPLTPQSETAHHMEP